MTILMYSKESDNTSQKLLSGINEKFTTDTIEMYENVDTLSKRLGRIGIIQERPIIVYHAVNIEDLKNLQIIKDTLVEPRIILIVHPALSVELNTLLNQLRPKYVTYNRDNCSEVIDVLGRMVKITAC